MVLLANSRCPEDLKNQYAQPLLNELINQVQQMHVYFVPPDDVRLSAVHVPTATRMLTDNEHWNSLDANIRQQPAVATTLQLRPQILILVQPEQWYETAAALKDHDTI
jgi:hypothetical protein